MKKAFWIVVLCLGIVYFIPKAPVQQSPKIITTFSILEDITKNILGDSPIQIKSLVPLNTDPHTYQLKPKDAILLEHADIIITNGAGFEGWLDRFISSNKIIVASKGLVLRHANRKKKETLDPHLWHSIPNVIVYVNTIKNALIAYDPNHKKIYEKNALDYIKNLKALHLEITTLFKDIPKTKRRVVTTHDAFWYFGHEYGIEFISPIGVSTEQEPSAKEIGDLINTIRKHNIKAIFIENLSNSKQLKQVAEESNSAIDGTLYADSLSKTSEGASTYIDMMRYNAKMIHKGLKG